MLSRIFAISVVFVLAFAAAEPLAVGAAASKAHEERSYEDDAELRRLMAVLEKHTEIATKTRMNADFVPGMVTVLYGDDLRARGVRIVWEALGLVPGIELSVQSQGRRRISVRGVGMTFGSGNTKFLLNGVSMNTALLGMASPILDLPMELVERIEVIRGPGAAVHGEFAYSGVVNIITRRQGNMLFGGLGSSNTYEGGGLLSKNMLGRDLRLSLGLTGMKTDGDDVKTGPDTLYSMGQSGISNAPGKTNEDRETSSALFNLEYKDFSLIGQYVNTGHGDFCGANNALPPPADRIVLEDEYWMMQARQVINLFESLQAEISLGYLEYTYDVDRFNLFPPGITIGPTTFNDGIIASPYYEESRLDGGVEFKWNGWNRHAVLLGWSFARTKVEDVWQETNYLPSNLIGGNIPMQRFDGSENWLEEDRDRLMNSVTLQDEFRISDQITITGGLRYDHYDDVGYSLNPRMAAVYCLSDDHILKVQFARAFRPPTFLEMYSVNNPVFNGNPDIDPETIDTYEIGYIYKLPRTVARATLFHSRLDDLIVLEGGQYANSGGALLTGAELELEHQFFFPLKFDCNVSFVNTEDQDTHEELVGAANWLANVGLTYQFHRNITFALQYRHVGDRNREPEDSRNDLDGYHMVNITGSLFNLGVRGLNLRLGVNNLFDDDVRYPALLNQTKTAPTYPDDYPGQERQWWMKLSYEF